MSDEIAFLAAMREAEQDIQNGRLVTNEQMKTRIGEWTGKIVWTEKASSDIEAIFRYIARRESGAAARIGLGIYQRVQILLEHPEAGTFLDELRDGGWRKLTFSPRLQAALQAPP